MAENRKLQIDLSGRGGLAPRFWGDIDRTVATPELRILGKDGQMADGIYNPFRRYGYMSPANATFTDVTIDAGTLSTISATIYDSVNNTFYFADRTREIFKGDTLDDVALTRDRDIFGVTFTDLEIYQTNGVRSLFYAYQLASNTFTADAGTDYITFSGSAGVAAGTTMTLTSSGTLPAGLSTSTTYYAVNPAGYTTQLSLTSGGAAINITDAGTGTHTATGNFSNIGRKNLETGSYISDLFFTTSVSGGINFGSTSEIMMVVSDNGFMYVLDGNTLHKYDGTTNGGTNGTLSRDILVFPNYFRIVDAIDYRGNMYIIIQKNTEDIRGTGVSVNTHTKEYGVYIWNRDVSLVSIKDIIPLEGVKQARKIYVSPQGDVRVIVVNSENITEIRKFNGSSFVAISEAGYLAHPQYRDSVTNISGLTTWVGYNGNIYAHGKISPFDDEGMFKIGNLPESIQTFGVTTGAVLFGGGNTDSSSGNTKPYKTGLYVSYQNASSVYFIKAWDIYGTGADGITSPIGEQGDVYTLVKFLPTMSTVNYIDIYNFPTITGSSACAVVKIYFNQSSTAWASKTITRDMASRGYITIDVDKPFINSIQIEIEFNTGTAPGSADFAPSLAVVDYTPTTARG